MAMHVYSNAFAILQALKARLLQVMQEQIWAAASLPVIINGMP